MTDFKRKAMNYIPDNEFSGDVINDDAGGVQKEVADGHRIEKALEYMQALPLEPIIIKSNELTRGHLEPMKIVAQSHKNIEELLQAIPDSDLILHLSKKGYTIKWKKQ